MIIELFKFRSEKIDRCFDDGFALNDRCDAAKELKMEASGGALAQAVCGSQLGASVVAFGALGGGGQLKMVQ